MLVTSLVAVALSAFLGEERPTAALLCFAVLALASTTGGTLFLFVPKVRAKHSIINTALTVHVHVNEDLMSTLQK